jgi:Effector Associated Constant Component 1
MKLEPATLAIFFGSGGVLVSLARALLNWTHRSSANRIVIEGNDKRSLSVKAMSTEEAAKVVELLTRSLEKQKENKEEQNEIRLKAPDTTSVTKTE